MVGCLAILFVLDDYVASHQKPCKVTWMYAYVVEKVKLCSKTVIDVSNTSSILILIIISKLFAVYFYAHS